MRHDLERNLGFGYTFENKIGERTTFAKAYGIKVRHYWERFGENVEKLGTYWELIGNIVGTK
jgi:hypothetical protein